MNMFCMIALICIAVATGLTVESVANLYGFYFGGKHVCEGGQK